MEGAVVRQRHFLVARGQQSVNVVDRLCWMQRAHAASLGRRLDRGQAIESGFENDESVKGYISVYRRLIVIR